ncbi:MAG: DUF1211 domain-containing protein [Kordiimonadaceae bacterium]|nr:DUF1211 domain-containing protein [Kordiimonadaceae bacterium]MBO6569827.1 DUF1211 domain-containing protein [Kordiimonadaceae bacterium]MBO6966077.1 DUF1211 domain-containing protein [Kordiimonadaceae bacterium]
MRRHMLSHEGEEMTGIRVRGVEVTRMEGLTDAMFGFAITLLIVSLEPPTSYEQLVSLMLSFPAFGVTFMLMMFIWYWHYRFFRQYGLNSGKVILANAFLMFVVLLFVFPLKFFATIVIDTIFLERWAGIDMPDQLDRTGLNYPILHTIYAIGFAAVFICFSWLYKLALDARDALDLTAYEQQVTRVHINMYLLVAAVPLLTIPLVWLPTKWAPMIAGMSNFFIWPVTMIYGRMTQPKLNALKEAS